MPSIKIIIPFYYAYLYFEKSFFFVSDNFLLKYYIWIGSFIDLPKQSPLKKSILLKFKLKNNNNTK